MYLDYDSYVNMGGTLDNSAFSALNRKAEYLINGQAGGKTGERIAKLTELPQAVKDCIFELITHLSANSFDGNTIQSESQTLGGQSESYSYSTLNKEQADEEVENIINIYLFPIKVNGVSILYRGADL